MNESKIEELVNLLYEAQEYLHDVVRAAPEGKYRWSEREKEADELGDRIFDALAEFEKPVKVEWTQNAPCTSAWMNYLSLQVFKHKGGYYTAQINGLGPFDSEEIAKQAVAKAARGIL